MNEINHLADREFEFKIWGRTSCVHRTHNSSSHVLALNANYHCSVHYHRDRANHFYINSGIVDIVEFCESNFKVTRLCKFDSYCVDRLILHTFIVVEDGEMVENYVGSETADDIVRLIDGGFSDDIEALPLLLSGRVSKLMTCLKIK